VVAVACVVGVAVVWGAPVDGGLCVVGEPVDGVNPEFDRLNRLKPLELLDVGEGM
jgi:hypothetical protein